MASDRQTYPLPIDPFTVLTILVPGAALFFSLPHDVMGEAVGQTVLGRALRGPAHWYHYPALIVLLFLLGVALDAVGRAVRAGLAQVIARLRGPRTPALLLEQLGDVLALKRSESDPPASTPAPVGGRDLHGWVTELTVLAAQVSRGRAFRAQDRTLAMLTNLGVAVALASFWSPMAKASGVGPVGAGGVLALLVVAIGFVLTRWWTELIFAASGVDLESFHETQRLEAERRLAENEQWIQRRMQAHAEAYTVDLRRQRDGLQQELAVSREIEPQLRRGLDEAKAQVVDLEHELERTKADVLERDELLQQRANTIWALNNSGQALLNLISHHPGYPNMDDLARLSREYRGALKVATDTVPPPKEVLE